MKRIILIITTLIATTSASHIGACPACVGRLDKDAPPFFSAEYDTYCHHGTSKEASTTATAATQPHHEQEKEKES